MDPTEEQLRNRKLAASGEISSETLAPTATLAFTQPQETSVFPVKDLELTEPEKQVQGLSEELQGLYTSLEGESAFRTGLEKEKGFADLEKTQQDLTSQLRMLQTEAEAIPIQIQQEFEGRGVTKRGVASIEKGRLRENAIKAFTVSSLLEASRGNLVLAQNQIDRAVAQKYDPIREKINTKINNLNLILQSPASSLADKNRAQKQLALWQQQQREIAKQDDNTKIAQAMNAAAVKLHPGNQQVLLATQRVQALNAADPLYLQKVYSLVGQYQSDPAEMQKDLDAHLLAQGNLEKIRLDLANEPLVKKKLEAEIARIESDTSLDPLKKQELEAQIAQRYVDRLKTQADIRKIDAEIVAKQAETGNLTTNEKNNLLRLTTQFGNRPEVKDYREMGRYVSNIDVAMKEAKVTKNFVAVDQTLINAFNKLNDPTSVVRESEYARTASDIALLNKLRGKWQKIQTGGAGLTSDEREAISRMAKNFYQSAKTRYDSAYTETSLLANELGVGMSFDTVFNPQTNSIESLAVEKGFDLAAAKAAGYTDEEIKQFLHAQ